MGALATTPGGDFYFGTFGEFYSGTDTARVRHPGEALPQPVEPVREVLHFSGGPVSAAMIAASTARRSAAGIAA